MLKFNAKKYFTILLISTIFIFIIFTFRYYKFASNEYGKLKRASSAAEQKTRVLLFSYFRSGTTFFSRLLSQHPGTLLHFEPIYMISGDSVARNKEEEARSLILLRHLLRCDLETVFALAAVNRTNWLWHYPRVNPDVIWPINVKTLQTNHVLAKAISEVCSQYPVHLVKIVRLPLQSLEPLLEEFPDLKIIFFARDPRPIYKSRSTMDWCTVSSLCIEPREFCAAMKKDLEYLQVLKNKYPERVKSLRFEDLVLDLNGRTKNVFRFLNFDYDASRYILENWLKAYSHAKNNSNLSPYSIMKSDSKSKAYEWKTTMTEEEISYVEESCGDVIDILSSLST